MSKIPIDKGAPPPPPAEARERMLEAYPSKTYRKRARQILVNNPDAPPPIGANSRTIPGIITQRGCCYAGCRGVVIGPIYDILHITHGPIGCGYYSWLTRRNLVKPRKDGETNFIQYCMSTDMQEEHIVFGGEKRLAQAIDEAVAEFHPKAIAIYATCPVGLIGDDIHAVAREAEARHGINVMAFSCEGYKGVSQSAGHHIANNKVFTDMVGLDDTPQSARFSINILGEYNIGGDAWEIHRVLDLCGIHVVGTLSGDVSYDDIANCHTADLNAVMCHRSINYMAEMMETKFGIPWIKVNFIGAESTAKSLRKIAQYFDDGELSARVEAVIEAELAAIRPVQREVRARCEGKTAALFVGGSRAHHYQDLFRDIGMKTIAAGYEFAHRDDYEGREVLPSVEKDADTRNIEELEVAPDPRRFRPRLAPERLEALKSRGLSFSDYKGMMREMDADSLVIDDISHHELETLIALYKPDIVCSGIKDKFIVEKMGVPCKQLHSYDYAGPYAGFAGAANFYREVDRMVNSGMWRHTTPPWRKEPHVHAKVAFDETRRAARRQAAAAARPACRPADAGEAADGG